MLRSLWLALGTGYFAAVVDSNVHLPDPDYSSRPPAVGGSYTDNTFGTSIKRISDALGAGITFITGEYSTMTPFNNDNSRILLVHFSYFGLYDGSGNFLKNLPGEINASSEPRWSRSDANVLYYNSGNQLKRYNVSTGATSAVHTFSEYSSITGKGESDICFDGNHFVFAGDNRYVFVYEISTDSKGPVFDTGGRGFDSLYITPNDNVSITWLGGGVELFNRNMNSLRQLTRAGGHMDYTRDTNGDEVLIWANSADPSPICDNGIGKVRLSDGNQTCLLSLDWSLAGHISGTDNSGSVFVETYAPGDPAPGSSGWVPYTNEILKVKLDGIQVERLAHHRSRPLDSYNYEPRVSASRDGSKIIYASNFGIGSPTYYADTYLISVSGGGGGTGGGGGGNGGGGGGTGGGGGGTGGGGGSTSTTQFEQDRSAVTYSGPWSGTWFVNNNSLHSGGSAALAMDGGSKATFAFTGTGVTWKGYRDEWSGIAKVYVDGVLKSTVDTYVSPPEAQTPIYSITGLTQASHTLTIEVTQTHNSSSGGDWVWVDGFDVGSAGSTGGGGGGSTGGGGGGSTGGGGGSTGGGGGSTATTLFEQNSSPVTYGGPWSGTWFVNNNSLHSGGSAALAMDAGSKATFAFTGTSVTWKGYRDEWSGIANVYVDGVLKATIDTYASPSKAQTPIYSIAGLTRASHTLTIEATQTNNSSSGGAWVWIDVFEITP